MRFLDFISVKLTFFLITGILIGFYANPDSSIVLVFLAFFLFALFLSLIFSKNNRFPLFGIAMALTTITSGIFAAVIASPKSASNHYSEQQIDQEALWLLKVKKILRPNAFSCRYIAEVDAFNDQSVSGKLLFTIRRDSIADQLQVDDELIVLGKARPTIGSLNPYGFDYSAYLKKIGVFDQLSIGSTAIISKQKTSNSLVGSADRFRQYLINKLRAAPFEKNELAVMQALLLGQRNGLSKAMYNDYKNAGAVHILAVSGLHIGILLLLLQFLTAPLKRLPSGNSIRLFFILSVLWAFAFIAGLSPSIVRAVTMFSFVTYALYLNRPTNTFNIVALSMFFLLLAKPMFLFQIGFQMSYAAVFAIIWIYPKLQRLWLPENPVIRKVWQLLSVSLAAQLGVLPISLFYFHEFPSLFFISNLIIVPALGIIFGIGILVLVLASFNTLPAFIAIGYNQIIKWMNTVVGWIAAQEDFVFKNIPFDGVQLVLAYLLIFRLIIILSKPKFKNIALFFIAVMAFQVWSIYNVQKQNRKELLLVMHQTAHTGLFHQKGDRLAILSKEKSNQLQKTITDYVLGAAITSVNQVPVQNCYQWNNKTLYIMDQTGIYPPHKEVDYLLLTQSPKIHLERLLDSIGPKTILADGSNYNSDVERWEATCLKKSIPFHYTGEKGAYYFDLKE